MTHDDGIDERERISRLEAVIFVEVELRDFKILVAAQPKLVHLLEMAQLEALAIIASTDGVLTSVEQPPSGPSH